MMTCGDLVDILFPVVGSKELLFLTFRCSGAPEGFELDSVDLFDGGVILNVVQVSWLGVEVCDCDC